MIHSIYLEYNKIVVLYKKTYSMIFFRQKTFLIALVLVSGAFVFGYYVARFNTDYPRQSFAIREYDERYEFIRPLLICQIDEKTENQEYHPLEKQIEEFISESIKSGKITDGSVYFRDLNTGRWIGVNEDRYYSPASLLKMPIMMTYLKEAQKNPALLNKKYTYIRKSDDISPLINERVLQSGKEYTVSELINGMITQSDNSAKDILTYNVSPDTLNETYNALEIRGVYGISQENYEISAKKYALFFRVLYNGTFLNREMSNKAIEILSNVEFDKGLEAGTPKNIKIAHKYGVSAVPNDNRNGYKVELSDCGIVYNPSSPYLLCVMTEGSDPYVLADIIKKISEITYNSAIINH